MGGTRVVRPRRVLGEEVDPGYNGVDRRSLLVIRVIAVHMYGTATKRKFFQAVVDRLRPVGIRPEDVLICLTENGAEDWYAGRP